MVDDSNLPAARIEIRGPQLRADHRGYVLGRERIDGFADRPDLDAASRRVIAEWARAFSPSHLDDRQRLLLNEPPTPISSVAEALRKAAIQNAEIDMPLAIDLGLYAHLADEQIRAVREPWSHLEGATRVEYPLSASQLAELTGTTAKKIRSWEESQLLPAYWIDGRRNFFSAAAVYAFALSGLDRNEIRGASRMLSRSPEDPFPAIVVAALQRSFRVGSPNVLARWLEPESPQSSDFAVLCDRHAVPVQTHLVRMFAGATRREMPPPELRFLPALGHTRDAITVVAASPSRQALWCGIWGNQRYMGRVHGHQAGCE
jgi:hypothetical protein